MLRKAMLFYAVSAAAITVNAQAEAVGDTQLAMAGLETVTISAQRNFRAWALKSDIVKTEVRSAAMIDRTNAVNINQALDNNPGIAIQVECSIRNVHNITLNDLPGRCLRSSWPGPMAATGYLPGKWITAQPCFCSGTAAVRPVSWN